MNILEIDELCFSYKDKRVISNLNLVLEKGKIGVIVGASGAGKTTLFQLILGICKPGSGSIIINGNAENRRETSYMMQEEMLLSWRTIGENILLPLELSNEMTTSSEKEMLELLSDLQLEGSENLYPCELSGGMKQRVSLARAIIQKRPLILLDEPFGALDFALRDEMYQLLRSIQKKHGCSILLITHDFTDALSIGDDLFLLKNGHIHKKWTLNNELRDCPIKQGNLIIELKNDLILAS